MFTGALPQLYAATAVTFSAISDGMQYGWSAPFIPILCSENSPIKITEHEANWLELIYLFGALSGLPTATLAVNKIGRKYSVLAASTISLTCWILIAVANNVTYLYVARYFTGMASNVAFVSTPMYVAEIADQKIRGFLSSLIFLMMLLGIVLIYVIAPYAPYYSASVIGGGILVIQIFAFSFQPESPYYLLSKGKIEEGRKSLYRLRTGLEKDIENELSDIMVAIERQKTERGRPQDLFLIKSNRKAAIIMLVLNGSQHFSSISVLLMNLHSILEAAGSIYMDSRIAAIAFSCFMLVAASSTSFVIDRFGRKILIIWSSISTALTLLILSIYFHLKHNGTDVTKASWIPIACVMIYAVTFKFGLGLIPIVLTAELFPAKVKAYGMTFSSGIYCGFALISIHLYSELAHNFGIHVPFYVFAATTLGTSVFAYFCIPETKGKTLDEIQFILKGLPLTTCDKNKISNISVIS